MREGEVRAAVHAARRAALSAFARRLPADVAGRLRVAHAACRITGLVPDTAEIRTVEAQAPDGPLLVVLNPRRATPHPVRGLPPPRPRPPCPLCDLPFHQLVAEVAPAGVRLRAAPSPAPYLPVPQWTLIFPRHLPQEPRGHPAALRLFAAAAHLVAEVPRLLVGWNGAGAGASVPHHRHLHALWVEEPLRRFPALSASDPAAVEVAGGPRAVAGELARALFDLRARDSVHATANLVVWHDGTGVRARLVPRDRRRERLPGLPEVAAGFLEAALRTVVLKTDARIRAFEEGVLDAADLARALRAVRPPLSLLSGGSARSRGRVRCGPGKDGCESGGEGG